MADISRHLELISKFLEKQSRNYPEAFGYNYFVLQKVLLPFATQSPPFDYTPAQVACKEILGGGELGGVGLMCEAVKSRNNDEEEMQGYIDAFSLYAATAYAKSNPAPAPFVAPYSGPFETYQAMSDGMKQIPRWDDLPFDVRKKAQEFVIHNSSWALEEFAEKDFFDGKGFMSKLVTRISNTRASRSYVRGVKTVRDTLSLYVDLIIAFLRGDFYTGP